MPFVPKRNLPRLERHHHQSHAVIFWTLTLEERARGWLKPGFHHAFRELMLHAAVRYDVGCPTYCLMPDHLHLLWMGMRRASDQLNAMKFLRTNWNPLWEMARNGSIKRMTMFCARRNGSGTFLPGPAPTSWPTPSVRT